MFLYRLKKISECGGGIRTLEKEVYMTKRTIMRYINLCYLSPKIVTDILVYRNPRNISLKELMTLAEGKIGFSEQEKEWDYPFFC